MGDTGTPTWTPPTGYTQLITRNNTTSNVMFFKIATASESDPVVGSNTNETYNGCVIAIRDVDTSYPFISTDVSTYATSNQDATQALGDGTTTGVGQSFAGVAGVISRARFYLSKTGTPTGTATARLYAHTGTFGSTGTPTGDPLLTSNTLDVSTLTGSLQLIDFYFPSPWFTLVGGTNYFITIEYSGGNGSNFVNVGDDGSSPSHAGNFASLAGTWSANSGRDAIFTVQRFTLDDQNAAAAFKTTHATITTERNNSIVLYYQSAAVAGVPAFLGGPVNHLTGGDGAAESMGVGWGYQGTAGTTANNVVCVCVAGGAGARWVVGVNPPLSGATVVPTYLVTDNCSLLDPLNGLTAFDNNTAFAATADTGFGTSLGGITANDATVATLADVGINSFHSMAAATNATTANQISGAELVFAVGNRPNIGTKNVLCHIRPGTPLQAQRFTNIASNRGAWFGVRSGAASNYKIWQVHAVDAPWAATAHVPVIINSGAGNTKATNGTLDTSTILAMGFWHGGITGSNTSQMTWGMAWLMDSIVVCGGNSTEPVTVQAIVRTTGAPGKERYSAILQGSRQILLLEDLQIGDGGTNPVYLNLDSTAIELPSQYNTSSKNINYNSTDNLIGITYYPGSSDTIIHTNSIVSSPSRYKWGLHSSASTSATYNFSGLSVIGAGTVTLNKAITITGLTLNNYSTLDVSNATLNSCTITNVPATNDSVTSNSTTDFIGCTINVSAVTSGNRWISVADPSIFATCSFTGGGGHAIRLTTTGTYNFSGNQFTGFGADGTNNAAIYNDSGGAVTINILGGGSTPTVRNGASASTTINNAVTLTVTVKNESNVAVNGARVRISKQSDSSLVANGTTNASGVYTASYNYTGSLAVNVAVRLKGYIPFDTTGTITTSGLDVNVRFIKDTIVD